MFVDLPAHGLVSIAAFAVVAISMLGELWLAKRNERLLLARGAVEVPDPAYRTMRWAYPAIFAAMAVEGVIDPREPTFLTVAGGALFALAKWLKYWAIATLGVRWSFRVLVVPGARLVDTGPYRLMRHPNYLAVVGELAGMAMLTGARWTGVAGIVFFGWLLRRRIAAEDRALRLN
jgi:methyltransferase